VTRLPGHERHLTEKSPGPRSGPRDARGRAHPHHDAPRSTTKSEIARRTLADDVSPESEDAPGTRVDQVVPELRRVSRRGPRAREPRSGVARGSSRRGFAPTGTSASSSEIARPARRAAYQTRERTSPRYVPSGRSRRTDAQPVGEAVSGKGHREAVGLGLRDTPVRADRVQQSRRSRSARAVVDRQPDVGGMRDRRPHEKLVHVVVMSGWSVR